MRRVPSLEADFIHDAPQFRQGLWRSKSDDAAPCHGEEAEMSFTAPARAGENNSGVKNCFHLCRPFLATW